MTKKLRDEEVRPGTSAWRYRYAKRRHAQLTYFTDEEWEILNNLTIIYNTNKSILIRNALNYYLIEPQIMEAMLQQFLHPEKDPYIRIFRL